MSKYQALIDALAGVNGQLGQPSLHSGHVIYAETEEWCSVDINVKLSANKHISGPLARFIKEAANPATIRALLDDLEVAEKALAAIAQQAQEPVAWLYVDTVGERYLCFSRPTGGGTITNLYTTPQPQPVPAPVDEREAFEAWMDDDGQGPAPRICSRGSPCEGEYADQCWETAWRVWQAGRATQPAPVVPADVARDARWFRLIRDGSGWPAVFASHDAPEPLRGDDLDAAMIAASQRKGGQHG